MNLQCQKITVPNEFKRLAQTKYQSLMKKELKYPSLKMFLMFLMIGKKNKIFCQLTMDDQLPMGKLDIVIFSSCKV